MPYLFFFFQAEDGIRDLVRSRGLGDVYKRQAQRESTIASVTNAKGQNAVPILSFLFAKLIAYTFLGFLLGWLGAVIQLSLSIKVFLQFAVVVFMLGTAMNLSLIHISEPTRPY